MKSAKQKLIVISGPTGSGKTELALKLAKKYKGYIINADSRTVYAGMDIGTAKATKTQRRLVKHYLIDIKTPRQKFTVGEFKRRAEHVIKTSKGIPFIVGGTGLYISALIENWQLGNGRGAKHKGTAKYDVLLLVLNPPRQKHFSKLNQRVLTLWQHGLVAETKRLRKKYSFSLPAFTGIGYREVAAYVDGTLTKARAIEKIQANTRQYAKRQWTWWRARKNVHWITNQRQAERLIKRFLK